MPSTLLLPLIFVGIAVSGALNGGPSGVLDGNFPADLRREYRDFVDWGRQRRYLTPEQYDEMESALAGARTDQEWASVIQQLVQFAFDHDRGLDFIVDFARASTRPEIASIVPNALPEEIELLRVAFKDGRVFIGTGGPLSRHFPATPVDRHRGRYYLHPNLGMPGMGNFWPPPPDIESLGRVKVPLPKLFLVRTEEEKIDRWGNLAIIGQWYRPGEGISREEIILSAKHVTPGGSFFVHERSGIHTLRLTYEYPGLASPHRFDAAKRREAGWLRTPPSKEPRLDVAFRKDVEKLVERAPSVSWPSPFNPPPDRVALAYSRTGWKVADAASSLLRLRLLLTYGEALPDRAFRDPGAIVALEEKVRSALKEEDPTLVESVDDLDGLAMILSDLRSDEPAPKRGAIAGEDEVYVQFPKEYSPWRQWPMLMALHGQGGHPESALYGWSSACRDAGVILVCPKFGSAKGAPKTKEADDRLIGLICRMRLRFNIDPNRIYLTGMSMGGAKTWHLVATNPQVFAAAAPEIRSPTRYDGSFRMLNNCVPVPLCVLEGEMDGNNVHSTRKAVDYLRERKATVDYRELPLVGHIPMRWLYADVLSWMLPHTRVAHPRTITHHAVHDYEGQHAWLAIRRLKDPKAWRRVDGTFADTDITAVRANYDGAVLTLDRVEGKPSQVEVFHDRAFMDSESITIRANGRTIQWTPQPTARRMMESVLRTGDRARPYGDSIRIRLD